MVELVSLADLVNLADHVNLLDLFSGDLGEFVG